MSIKVEFHDGLWHLPLAKPIPETSTGPDLFPRSYTAQVRSPLGQSSDFTMVVCAEGHQEVVCDRMSKRTKPIAQGATHAHQHSQFCHQSARWNVRAIGSFMDSTTCVRSPAHITGNTIARVSHACLSVSVVWCSQVVTLSFPGAITAIPWDSHIRTRSYL